MASFTQALGNTGTTSPVATTVAKPATGALLVVWLFTISTGHISAVSVTDNGSNTGWNISSSEQAGANEDFLFAWRVATATDHASMTSVQWNWTGTSTSPSVMEFDEIATGFTGAPLLDPGGAFGNTDGSTTSVLINALASGSSKRSSGEIALFGISWTTQIGSWTSWQTQGTPPLPAPTSTGGTPAATRLQVGWCVTTGTVTFSSGATSDCVSANWTTSRPSGMFGALFYDSEAVSGTGSASLSLSGSGSGDINLEAGGSGSLSLSAIEGAYGTGGASLSLSGNGVGTVSGEATASLSLAGAGVGTSYIAPPLPVDPDADLNVQLLLANLWSAAKNGHHYSGAHLSWWDIWNNPNGYGMPTGLTPEWNQYELTTGQFPAVLGINAYYALAEPLGGSPGTTDVWGNTTPDWAQLVSPITAVLDRGSTIMCTFQTAGNPCVYLYTTTVPSASTVAAINAAGTLTVASITAAAFNDGRNQGILVCSDGLHTFTYTGYNLGTETLTGVVVGGDTTQSVAANAMAGIPQQGSELSNLPSPISHGLPIQWSSSAYLTTGVGTAGSYAQAQALHANGNLNAYLDGFAKLAVILGETDLALILRLFPESNFGQAYSAPTGGNWYSVSWFAELWQYAVGYLTGNGGYSGQPVTSTSIASISGNGSVVTVTLAAASSLQSGQTTTFSGLTGAFASLNGTSPTIASVTSSPGQPTVFTIASTLTGAMAGSPVCTTPVHNLLFAYVQIGSNSSVANTYYPPADLVDFVAIDCYSNSVNIPAALAEMQAATGYSNTPAGVTELYGQGPGVSAANAYLGIPVSSIVGNGSQLTITTSVAHNLVTGDVVQALSWPNTDFLLGVDGYQYTITVTGSTTFTVVQSYFTGTVSGITGAYVGQVVDVSTLTAGTILTGTMLDLLTNTGVFPASGSIAIPTSNGIQTISVSAISATGQPAEGTVAEFTVSSVSGVPSGSLTIPGSMVTNIDSTVESTASLLTSIKTASTNSVLPYCAFFCFFDGSFGLSQLYQGGMSALMNDSTVLNQSSGLSGFRGTGAASLSLIGAGVGSAEIVETGAAAVSLAGEATGTVSGSAGAMVDLEGSGAGAPTISDTPGASVTINAHQGAFGTGGASLALAAQSSPGTPNLSGSVAASISLVAGAIGTVTGTAAATVDLLATSVGYPSPYDTPSAELSLSAAAIGSVLGLANAYLSLEGFAIRAAFGIADVELSGAGFGTSLDLNPVMPAFQAQVRSFMFAAKP